MADDPKKRGQDSKLVSQQQHEVDYLVKTTGKSRAEVERAIKDVGPSREKVLKKLKGG